MIQPVNEQTCLFCLENIEESYVYDFGCQCNIQYHKHCILSWIKVKNRCPVCGVIPKDCEIDIPNENIVVEQVVPSQTINSPPPNGRLVIVYKFGLDQKCLTVVMIIFTVLSLIFFFTFIGMK